MTTPLNAFKDAVASIWEAATPPDRAEITYHRIVGNAPLDGATADRGFWFDQSVRDGPVSEAVGPGGSMVTYVFWTVAARVRLSAAGRGLDVLENATNNELNLLARLLERYAAWPLGVVEVIQTGSRVDFDKDSEDAVLALSMRVLCAETDGN